MRRSQLEAKRLLEEIASDALARAEAAEAQRDEAIKRAMDWEGRCYLAQGEVTRLRDALHKIEAATLQTVALATAERGQ